MKTSSVMVSALNLAAASLALLGACSGDTFLHESFGAEEQGAPANENCEEHGVRLNVDECGICECRNDAWQCEPGVRDDAGACLTPCETGAVAPPHDHCGVCSCIDGQWVCDSVCECEHEYFDDDCAPGFCNWYGFEETTSRCESFTSGDQPAAPPGEDPFATQEPVPCDAVVQDFLAYRSPGRSWDDPPSAVAGMRVEGTELILDIEFKGGCDEHRFGLCMSPYSFDAHDARRFELFVAHDPGDDVCGDVQRQTLRFELQSLGDQYRQRAEVLGFPLTGPVVVDVEGVDGDLALHFD